MDRDIVITDIITGTGTTVQVTMCEICTTPNIPQCPTIDIIIGLTLGNLEITILQQGITITLEINKTGREVQRDTRISVTEEDSTTELIMTKIGDRVILKFMMIVVDMTVRDV